MIAPMPDDPVPAVPLLGYSGGPPATPLQTRASIVLALAGLVVALVALGYNLWFLGILIWAIRIGLRLTAIVRLAALLLAAACCYDVAIAISLFVVAILLLRRGPTAARRLRKWATHCLIGVGIFTAAYLLLLSANAGGRVPANELLWSLLTAAAGSVYPLSALFVTRRRPGL